MWEVAWSGEVTMKKMAIFDPPPPLLTLLPLLLPHFL
jgi:hypothetical protein